MNVNPINIAIIGATGSIGHALIDELHDQAGIIYAFSRKPCTVKSPKILSLPINIENEASILAASNKIQHSLDIILVTTGFLHDDHIKPEKALTDLNCTQCEYSFLINTIGPMLVAKHFLPKAAKNKAFVFAALSARVGSISDNRLGGWYSYRASKAALNMMLKSASIEMRRSHPKSIIVGLHPGTVDTLLSKPFQTRIPPQKLFTPSFSAKKLVHVIENLTPEDTGKLWAWDGTEINY